MYILYSLNYLFNVYNLSIILYKLKVINMPYRENKEGLITTTILYFIKSYI